MYEARPAPSTRWPNRQQLRPGDEAMHARWRFWRRVSGDRGPIHCARPAHWCLAGSTRLEVEFTGLRWRVTGNASNVPAGAQQILLGRYLPEGRISRGSYHGHDRQAGRYVSKITLKKGRAGNSFVPRLWARMHLDKLLEQGHLEAMRQDVIAAQRVQHHHAVPSLLVLRHADRAPLRGETPVSDAMVKFFAEGRDNAVFELTQQMTRRCLHTSAECWRIQRPGRLPHIPATACGGRPFRRRAGSVGRRSQNSSIARESFRVAQSPGRLGKSGRAREDWRTR